MIELTSGLVTWRLLSQRHVTVSSTEAEYVPLVESMRVVRYLHHILRKLGGFHEPTKTYEEKQPCTVFAFLNLHNQ